MSKNEEEIKKLIKGSPHNKKESDEVKKQRAEDALKRAKRRRKAGDN